MLSIVQSSNDILPIENPAISALLNTFQEIAHQKGLKLEVEIHDNLSNLPCTVYEINTVLGNLIQNAIDELERDTEGSRIIHVLIIKRGNNNMIKVSNYCHKSVEEMKDIFTPGYTTKPKHEGLGLLNASKMVEKYNGIVYPEFEDHMIHMIARIPMKY
jgi:two-component system, LytTR family, sensor histidine kinase AgrC